MSARDAPQPERLARVALATAREPGDPWLARAVGEIGAVELHDHLRSGRHHTGAAEQTALRLREVDAERELERAERLGLRFVVPGDVEWPQQLDDLAHAEPVNDVGGVPVGLWVRGPGRLDQLERSVAVVGARSSTTYGEEVAGEIAARSAAEGWAVVSGGAFGIDAAAHRGALAAGGRTVAVLACGADRVYPSAHAELLDHIAEQHLRVSETPPGGSPFKHRFLSRNRLVAALARGTVVVEAAGRSGALNSATWATRLHRPLMGVPGPVTSVTSEGVHHLLRTGRASVVTCGDDVLELVGEMGGHAGSEPRREVRPHDRLGAAERHVLEAVPAVRPASPASIAEVAGVPADEAEMALLVLADARLVEPVGRGWRLARQPAGGSAGS